MKKSYTFRLDPTLIKQLMDMGTNKTQLITEAIQLYVKGNVAPEYDSNIVAILQDQILDLKHDKIQLRNQVNALMVDRLPWYRKLFLKEINW